MMNKTWKGNSMEQIYRGLDPWLYKHFPTIDHCENHSVLYQLPYDLSSPPPKPHKGIPKWDSEHVRLPSSSKNQYPVMKEDGTEDIENRWDLIKQAYTKPILSSRELEDAILSYNTKYSKIWKFLALHKLFEKIWTEAESLEFFKDTFPTMVELALRLSEIICCPIPLLRQNQTRSVSFSQQQVACLLANAFLCTFPRRNTQKTNSEYKSFPRINFNRLFQSAESQSVEKIKCICNYFRRVCKKMPTGVITISRRSMANSHIPNWNACYAPFKHARLHVTSVGTIEDQGVGLLQVDFANRFIGGGVLGHGCVQEEIRFVICPEMFVSKLITECMQSNEALFIIGCERYNNYTGYASNFKWNGDCRDDTPRDECGRKQCCIVAIDATHFQQAREQFKEERMERELKKAYVGYYYSLKTPAPGVATGNWGCGAFGGNKKLKALLQLMVCCSTFRPLVYYTFGDDELRDSFVEMFNYLVQENITVAKLWSYLKEFDKQNLQPDELYPFIYQLHVDQKKKLTLAQDSTKKTQSNSESVNPLNKKHASEQNTMIFYAKRLLTSEENFLSNNSCVTTAYDLYKSNQITAPSPQQQQQPSTSNSKTSFLASLDQDYYQTNSTVNDETNDSNLVLLKCLDESYSNNATAFLADDSNSNAQYLKQHKNNVSTSPINDNENVVNDDNHSEAINTTILNNVAPFENSDSIDDVIPASPESTARGTKIRTPYQKKVTDFFS